MARPLRVYISDLLNSSRDNPVTLTLRWLLWFSVPVVIYGPVRERAGVWSARFLAAAWALAILTGLQPQVFGAPLPDALRYAHYGGTGVVFLASCAFLWVARWRRAAALWAVISVAYCALFLAKTFDDRFDMASQVFMAVEYVFYLQVTAVALLWRPLSPALPLVRVTAPRRGTGSARSVLFVHLLHELMQAFFA